MTTEQRLDAVRDILIGMQNKRFKSYIRFHKPSDAEKAIGQLMLICRNQQQELNALMAVEQDRLEKVTTNSTE